MDGFAESEKKSESESGFGFVKSNTTCGRRRVCSDQQRGDADPARRVDGRRAPVDGGRAVGRRRSDVRARVHARRGGDGVLRRRRLVALP